MTEHDTARQGHSAAEVLDNPAYQQGIAALKAQTMAQLLACPMADRDQQVLLIQLNKLAGKLDSILRGFIEGGKLAQSKINIDSERNESVARKALRRVL